MPATLTSYPATSDVGDTWRGWLTVTGIDGAAATADAVTIAVTDPAGAVTAGSVTAQASVGLYLLECGLASAGEYVIVITVASTTFGDDVIAAVVTARSTSGSRPDLSAVMAYLGDTSHSDAEVADALAAEQVAQARACVLPADFPADLGQALKRRVARNLAARAVPVATYTSFEGGGTSTRLPKYDAEVVRLEAPYRRLAVG
jgi:hypothetical protein